MVFCLTHHTDKEKARSFPQGCLCVNSFFSDFGNLLALVSYTYSGKEIKSLFIIYNFTPVHGHARTHSHIHTQLVPLKQSHIGLENLHQCS